MEVVGEEGLSESYFRIQDEISFLVLKGVFTEKIEV